MTDPVADTPDAQAQNQGGVADWLTPAALGLGGISFLTGKPGFGLLAIGGGLAADYFLDGHLDTLDAINNLIFGDDTAPTLEELQQGADRSYEATVTINGEERTISGDVYDQTSDIYEQNGHTFIEIEEEGDALGLEGEAAEDPTIQSIMDQSTASAVSFEMTGSTLWEHAQEGGALEGLVSFHEYPEGIPGLELQDGQTLFSVESQDSSLFFAGIQGQPPAIYALADAEGNLQHYIVEGENGHMGIAPDRLNLDLGIGLKDISEMEPQDLNALLQADGTKALIYSLEGEENSQNYFNIEAEGEGIDIDRLGVVTPGEDGVLDIGDYGNGILNAFEQMGVEGGVNAESIDFSSVGGLGNMIGGLIGR